MLDNIILGRVYSGVKLFWSSQSSKYPYPYQYHDAGDIFLHNAIQSKIRMVNGTTVIYLAAEDEIFRYILNRSSPYVFCYSTKAVLEEYALKYSYACNESSKGS